MVKLKGKAKAAFLRRMAAGRRKAGNIAKTVKRRVTKRRKSVKVKRKSSSNRTMTKKSHRSKARGLVSKITSGPVKKIALGIGFGSLAGTVIGFVAPQFAPIARPIAAFIGGGPIGLISDLVLSGGINQLGGLFGFGGTQQGGQAGPQELV